MFLISTFLLSTISAKAIYNKGEEKEVKFKAYDASTGIVYPMLQSTKQIKYVADDFIGSLDEPVILSPSDYVQQSIPIVRGWSWISLNVTPQDPSINAVMQNVEDVLYIKDKTTFASCGDDNKWHGNLSTIKHSEMYKVNASNTVVLDVIGAPVNLIDNEISIDKGWNWIGYNPTFIMSVGDAFANLNPVNGDIVKSRDVFSVFDGYEWTGTLMSMTPGMGYIYKSNDSKSKNFTYPSVSANSRGGMSPSPMWSQDYPNNMNVIAVVKDGDAVVENAAVEVYADNSLRGVSKQSVVDNKHFVTIYGDKSAERLTFNVVVDGIVYEVENTIDFSEDAVVGTLDNPYIIQLNNDIQIDGINVYPTLVKDILNISSKENINNVSVYNVNGLEVYRGESYSESTQINLENLNSGTYFVKVMTENGNVKVRCVVKY